MHWRHIQKCKFSAVNPRYAIKGGGGGGGKTPTRPSKLTLLSICVGLGAREEEVWAPTDKALRVLAVYHSYYDYNLL